MSQNNSIFGLKYIQFTIPIPRWPSQVSSASIDRVWRLSTIYSVLV